MQKGAFQVRIAFGIDRPAWRCDLGMQEGNPSPAFAFTAHSQQSVRKRTEAGVTAPVIWDMTCPMTMRAADNLGAVLMD